MIGIDTNILVAYAIPEHPAHGRVREHMDGGTGIGFWKR
jgi:predicted nucleic acid-binding protein